VFDVAEGAEEIVFLQRQDEQLVETDTLYVKGAFYVKVTFDQKPAAPSRKVTLTFNTGKTKTVEVSASSFGPKVYDTSPLHLSQLDNFPKLPDDTPSPAPKVKDPSATKYPYKATVVLKYEEVTEAPPENSPQLISASIDDKKANANIIMRGVTVNATLKIPIELKLHEAEGEIPYFYLTQGDSKLIIDNAMSQSSTAVLKKEKQDVEKKLGKWRITMDEKEDLFKKEWIKEGIVTFLIDEPFSELVKFGKPQETLSKERKLNLDGEDLVPMKTCLDLRALKRSILLQTNTIYPIETNQIFRRETLISHCKHHTNNNPVYIFNYQMVKLNKQRFFI